MSRDNSKSSFVEGKLVEYLNKALLSQQQTEGATSNDVDELKQIGYKLKKFLYLQLYAIEKFSSAYGSDETIKRGLEIEAEVILAKAKAVHSTYSEINRKYGVINFPFTDYHAGSAMAVYSKALVIYGAIDVFHEEEDHKIVFPFR